METIAVAGATGTVGRHVMAALTAAGQRAVPLSRSVGVDVRTGHGLAEALHGADAVIDVLNVATRSAAQARAFFTETTASLLRAERAAGVGHHVALSIVGIDDAPAGYYVGKLAQEELVRAGEVPWTILRATQFHDFAAQMLDATALGPVSLVPVARVRPVATTQVAGVLAEIACGEAHNAAADLRGPCAERLVAMARRVARARGSHRLVLPLPLPGPVGRVMRSGALCGDESATTASGTFTDWLRETYRARP